jgi:ribosomal protein S18 acetylase RimI-like enzyme
VSSISTPAHSSPSPIRPVNLQSDLGKIADLIETCFSDQMDDEGRAYVRQIRMAAQDTTFTRLLPGANERVLMPLGGYVWIEAGRLIGNLTLIPFYRSGHWRYLIANVAVQPEYRQRGIGRALTAKAIEHIRQRRAEPWLQVRQDNPNAIHLYSSLGFVERARRTSWEATGAEIGTFTSTFVSGPRLKQDWPLQSAWLRSTYPPQVEWNLGFHLERMRPGLWQGFQNFFLDTPVHQYAVYAGEKLAGTASWDPGPNRGENLWLAAEPDREEEAIYSLLVEARRRFSTRRPLAINYPAGQAEIGFIQAGFVKQNTLIWMEQVEKEVST